MYLTKWNYLALGTAVGLVLPMQAYAQSGDVADIVVTARRVEERLQDVPISITVFNQQQITNRNIVSAGDLATYTPSLSSNSRFGSDNTSFAIRGFTQDGSTSPSVGVYFADVVAPRAIGGTTLGNGAGPGSFFDLQNVQVLKGPQGTLQGRNTTGGAVILVPQKPTGQFGGYVEASAGNYGMRRFQAVVNIPVMDSLRVRLGVDRQTRDGYLINRSTVGPRDFSDVDYWAVRASVVADLTPNLENYFIASYSISDTNGGIPKVTNCDRAPSPTAFLPSRLGPLACAQIARATTGGYGFYDVENSVQAPRQKIQQFQLINTTSWRASDTLTVRNIVSYGEFREYQRGSLFGDNLIITNPADPNVGKGFSYTYSNPYPGLNSASQSTFTEELQLQGRTPDDRLVYQGGLYMEISEPLGYSGSFSPSAVVCNDPSVYNCQMLTGYPSQVSNIASRIEKVYFRNYGIYGQATYKLNDHFSITAGLRYTYDKMRASARALTVASTPVTTSTIVGSCINTITFGATSGRTEDQCQQNFKQKSEKPTWLIDIDYKPIDDILVYAKYARGYRQGGIAPFAFGSEIYGPEKVDSYELGLKTSWRGAIHGTFNVAAFYNDFSDQQLQVGGNRVAGSPSQIILNAGKSTIKGVEVDASLSPFKGFTVDAAYAYLDTKLKTLAFPAANSIFSSYSSTNLAGEALTLAPKNKYSVTASYVLPLDESIGRISFGATFSHTDSQYATYQGTTAFRAGLTSSDSGRIASQDLLNLNASWNSIAGSPVDLSFFMTNVTNEKYISFPLAAFTSFGFDAANLAPPRMYGARLRVRFGN